MEQKKKYKNVDFSSTEYEDIFNNFKDLIKSPESITFDRLNINKENESWNYDSFEEFVSEIKDDVKCIRFAVSDPDLKLEITQYSGVLSYDEVSSNISSENRADILKLSNIISICAKRCRKPEKEMPQKKIKIFIGHGGNSDWKDLKEHLQEQHKYEVVSYETGARAGHAIRDVIDRMLEEASFAILVMTGEDKMDDGTVRARQNVIHELGLFQGKLGFEKAIVLKEEGTEEFSNINGVSQIRYKNDIRETFGDILATLKREFE